MVPASPAGMSSMAQSSVHGVASRRVSDEVMLDMGRLMDEVRQDVMTLMQDGLQKTASFCAHQCAKRVLAARREMHQKLQEQKRDFERVHGIRLSHLGQSSAKATPSSSVFPSFTPRTAEGFPPWPGGPSAHGVSNTPRSTHTPRSFTKGTPQQLTPRSSTVGSRTNGHVFLDPSMAFDPYIDAHVAVQDLEEKTKQASRALHLIEEAIKVTTDDSAPRNVPTVASCKEVLEKGPVADNSHHAHRTVPDECWETLPPAVARIEPAAARVEETNAPRAGEAVKATTSAAPHANFLVGALVSGALPGGALPGGALPGGSQTPRCATPRGRTAGARGDTPPRQSPRREAEGERNSAGATSLAEEVLLQVPVVAQPLFQPCDPIVVAPAVLAEVPTPTVASVVEESNDAGRRSHSVSSMKSEYSLKGASLHGC